MVARPAPKRDANLGASSPQIWHTLPQNWVERYTLKEKNLAIDHPNNLCQAPILVFEDADLKVAVNGVAFSAFVASGQTCVSGARIIVHERIYDEFLSALLEKTMSITRRIGDRKWIIGGRR